jgi:hypothetical protein
MLRCAPLTDAKIRVGLVSCARLRAFEGIWCQVCVADSEGTAMDLLPLCH